MQVGEEDVGDSEMVLVCEREILPDVALRIHHRGDAGLLVADEIRRVREAIQVELVQDHDVPSLARDSASAFAKATAGDVRTDLRPGVEVKSATMVQYTRHKMAAILQTS
jgi:hypothetical protein